jgi:hypothetical protein
MMYPQTERGRRSAKAPVRETKMTQQTSKMSINDLVTIIADYSRRIERAGQEFQGEHRDYVIRRLRDRQNTYLSQLVQDGR